MAPAFLEVARESYRDAPPEETGAAFAKWLGSVTALAGIVEDVGDAPLETLELLASHAQECLDEMGKKRSQGLSDAPVEQGSELTQLLERTRRRIRRAQASGHGLEPVTGGARRRAEVVASAIGQVLRWLFRSLRR